MNVFLGENNKNCRRRQQLGSSNGTYVFVHWNWRGEDR